MGIKIVQIPPKYGDGLGFLFNRCTQLLFVENNWGVIDSCQQNAVEYSFIEFERSKLKVGDSAICLKDEADLNMVNVSNFCKIISDHQHVSITCNYSIEVSNSNKSAHWYKIVVNTNQNTDKIL